METDNKRFDFTGVATSDRSFVVFFVVIFSFLTVSLWLDAVQKIFYDWLGFDRDSPGASIFLALTMTIMIVCVVTMIK